MCAKPFTHDRAAVMFISYLQVLFAKALARRLHSLAPRRMFCASFHPGIVNSGLWRHLPPPLAAMMTCLPVRSALTASQNPCDHHSSASIAATRRGDSPVFGDVLSRRSGSRQRRLLRRFRGGGGASVLRRPGDAGALVELQPAPVPGSSKMKSFTECGM